MVNARKTVGGRSWGEAAQLVLAAKGDAEWEVALLGSQL